MSAPTFRVRCRAKINTHLRVLGRRQDGYHDLDARFVSLELHDTLVVAADSKLSLRVGGPMGARLGEADNLVLRAARALQSRAGGHATPGARMVLEKRIPVAAGLGGGSSDAAGALVSLVRAWGLQLDSESLAALALELGSDVPYFLLGGHCRGLSRGEQLQRLEDPPQTTVVLLHPQVPLSTARVFAEHSRRRGEGGHPGLPSALDENGSLTIRKPATSFDQEAWWKVDEPGLVNDLWSSALALVPGLADLRKSLELALPGAAVGMTGSGPTLFALLPEDLGEGDRLDAALARVRQAGADVLVTRTLGAREYRESHVEVLPGAPRPGG
jgi:4-diphosphocytidyl-2-C-methyl-D-erythritol kinase